MQNYVITIGRQFGSGGRELGKLIASTFGIKFYDKQLLTEAARHSGMNPELFENADEKAPSFLNGMFAFNLGMNPTILCNCDNTISDESIYNQQSEFIKMLATKEPCVIVGRTADYILRDHPHAVNIFVHAEMPDCVARIMKRGDCKSYAEAEAKARKINKLRAGFYNFYSDKHWGDATSYDLTFNSSKIKMEDAVAIIAEYIRRRYGIEPIQTPNVHR